jgi:ubiquitin-conjugating enzyme E2 Z
MSFKTTNVTNVLSLYAKKRIFADTKDLYKNPLTDMGIYYQNDEDDLSIGYCLIIGPKNTPYQYGYYLFQFNYPTNYPFEPPKVKFLTNDGETRYNPNLYRNGKVCLSLLNTWEGPSWKPCQTLRSVLISILTNVFVENPFTNEPSQSISSPGNIPYNESIKFKNIEFACISMYLNTTNFQNKAYELFLPTIRSHFKNNYEKIKEYILQCQDEFNQKAQLYEFKKFYDCSTNIVKTQFYMMYVKIDYNMVVNSIEKIIIN